LRVKCSQLGISLRKCRASRAAALEQSAKPQFANPSGPAQQQQVNAARISYNGYAAHFSNGSNLPLATMNGGVQMRTSPAMTNPAIAAAANLAFKTDRMDVPLVVVVTRQTLLQLRQWGATKGMTAEGLAAELLNVIAAEGLYKAILDEDAA
jgi:hypothetical protein